MTGGLPAAIRLSNTAPVTLQASGALVGLAANLCFPGSLIHGIWGVLKPVQCMQGWGGVFMDTQ